MIRKNSEFIYSHTKVLIFRCLGSRANFNPLSFNDTSNESGPRAPLFVQTRQRPTDIRQLAPLSSSSLSSPKPNVDSPTTSNSQLGYGNLIQDYMVERVHRLKPKCPSKLGNLLAIINSDLLYFMVLNQSFFSHP